MLRMKYFVTAGMIVFSSIGAASAASFSVSTDATASQADAGSPPDSKSASGAARVSAASANLWKNVIENPFVAGNTLSLEARSSAGAAADFGLLRLGASQTLTARTDNPRLINNGARPNSAFATASASAVTKDSFIVSAAGIPSGTQGALRASIEVSGAARGAITNDNSDSYGWGLGAFLASQVGLPGGSGGLNIVHFINGSGNPILAPGQTFGDFGLYTIDLNFLFGVPIAVNLEGTAATKGHAECTFQFPCSKSVSFTADLGNSITWQGITVTDSLGKPINSFTAWNPTGDFNYASPAVDHARPVPEPSSPWLVLSALAMLTARRFAHGSPAVSDLPHPLHL